MSYLFRNLLIVVVATSLIFLISSLAYFPVHQIQAAKSKSRDEVTLNQGQALRVEFKSKLPERIQTVSFKVKTIDTSDPFAIYHVPLTVQVFEKNRLIGSESFSSDLRTGFNKVHIDVNNDPMIKGNYKIVISFDKPEFNTDDNKIKVDLDTIKFNNGKVRMELHGDIKIISANA